MVNDSESDFDVKASDSAITVPAKSQVPVHFNPADFEAVYCKTSSSPNWMAPFDIRNVGKLFLRTPDEETRLFRIGRSIRTPNYFITISLSESWPFILRNSTRFEVSFRQKVPVCSFLVDLGECGSDLPTSSSIRGKILLGSTCIY